MAYKSYRSKVSIGDAFVKWKSEREKRRLSNEGFALLLLSQLEGASVTRRTTRISVSVQTDNWTKKLNNCTQTCSINENKSIAIQTINNQHSIITQTNKLLTKDIGTMVELCDVNQKSYTRKSKAQLPSHMEYGLPLESSTPQKVATKKPFWPSSPVSPLGKCHKRQKILHFPDLVLSPVEESDKILTNESHKVAHHILASPEEHVLCDGLENINEEGEQDNLNFSNTFTEGAEISDGEEDPEQEFLGDFLDRSQYDSLLIEESEGVETNETSVINDSLALVHLPTLLSLLRKAYGSKCCGFNGCHNPIEYKTTYFGTAIQVTWCCTGTGNDGKRHTKGKWNSQPLISKLHSGNLIVASAISLSGNMFGKVAMFMRVAKILFFGKDTYNNYQDHFICPAVNEYYKEAHKETFRELEGKSLVLAGDGRNDSPGHSSMFCSYTLADIETKKIVTIQTRDVRHAKGKSCNMEILGFELALQDTIAMSQKFGSEILEVVTDGHVQIKALMAKRDGVYSKIKHSWDIWHAAKNLVKKLMEVASKKGFDSVAHWAPLIKNHFWFCARVCQGDSRIMKHLWLSLLQHICNIHQWQLPLSFDAPMSCLHEAVSEDQLQDHDWLIPNSPQFNAIKTIITKPNVLNNLGFFSNFRHTGFLENFHSMLLKYTSKRFAFSYKVYDMRTKLAVIDHNAHVGRARAKTKDGTPRDTTYFSKRSKAWYVVPLLEPKEYVYIDKIMVKILKKRATFKGSMKIRGQRSPSDPRNIHKNRGMVDAPQKSVLRARQESRFTGEKTYTPSANTVFTME